MAEEPTPQQPTTPEKPEQPDKPVQSDQPEESDQAVQSDQAERSDQQGTAETSHVSGPAGTPAAPVTPLPDTGYTEAGVPTFEGVREKIETRYGTALGSTELAAETTESRSAAQQFEARERAAKEKLEEIRASMHKPGQG